MKKAEKMCGRLGNKTKIKTIKLQCEKERDSFGRDNSRFKQTL